METGWTSAKAGKNPVCTPESKTEMWLAECRVAVFVPRCLKDMCVYGFHFLQMPSVVGRLEAVSQWWLIAVTLLTVSDSLWRKHCVTLLCVCTLQIYSMTLRLSALFEEKMKKISFDFKIGQKFKEKLRRSQRFKQRQSCAGAAADRSGRWGNLHEADLNCGKSSYFLGSIHS